MASIQDLLDEFDKLDKSPLGPGFDLRFDLSEIIQRHLGEDGRTPEKLAEAAGITAAQFDRLAHGLTDCTFARAGRIFHALGVRVKLVEEGKL